MVAPIVVLVSRKNWRRLVMSPCRGRFARSQPCRATTSVNHTPSVICQLSRLKPATNRSPPLDQIQPDTSASITAGVPTTPARLRRSHSRGTRSRRLTRQSLNKDPRVARPAADQAEHTRGKEQPHQEGKAPIGASSRHVMLFGKSSNSGYLFHISVKYEPDQAP
jgi:hypothetical protein